MRGSETRKTSCQASILRTNAARNVSAEARTEPTTTVKHESR